tara:strand:- start:892 stop:1089 length:198 start_codon:yes stop_codon:yes gene_type:complete
LAIYVQNKHLAVLNSVEDATRVNNNFAVRKTLEFQRETPGFGKTRQTFNRVEHSLYQFTCGNWIR